MTLSILKHKHYLLLCGGLLSLTANIFAAEVPDAFNANDDNCWKDLECIRESHPTDDKFIEAVKGRFPQKLEVLELAKALLHEPDQDRIAEQPVVPHAVSRRQIGNQGYEKKAPALSDEAQLEIALALSAAEESRNALKESGDGKDNAGRPSLHLAVERGNLEEVTALIRNGADVNAKDYRSHTPLHLALSLNRQEAVRALIAADSDVDAKNTYGSTPLHWAAVRGNVEAVRLLIEKNAIVTMKDRDGKTPLNLVEKGKYKERYPSQAEEIENMLREAEAKSATKQDKPSASAASAAAPQPASAPGTAVDPVSKARAMAPTATFRLSTVQPAASALAVNKDQIDQDNH